MRTAPARRNTANLQPINNDRNPARPVADQGPRLAQRLPRERMLLGIDVDNLEHAITTAKLAYVVVSAPLLWSAGVSPTVILAPAAALLAVSLACRCLRYWDGLAGNAPPEQGGGMNQQP